jgi:hypothetical protein
MSQPLRCHHPHVNASLRQQALRSRQRPLRMNTRALKAITVLAFLIGPMAVGQTPAHAEDSLQFGPAPTTGPKAPSSDQPAPRKTQPAKVPQPTPETAQKAAPKPTPAKAPATGIPKPGEAPMRVVLVRDATPGCQPTCTEWISAEGYIDRSAVPQFKKILNELGNKKLPILVDSPGGSVDDALAIGRLIRAKGLDVVVTKTKFAICEPADGECIRRDRSPMYGAPNAMISKCASSCAFILAAGTRRFVGAHAHVGVHQLRTFQTFARLERRYRIHTRHVWGVPQEIKRELISERTVGHKTVETKTGDRIYRSLRTYFTEMGIQPDIMPMLINTPPTGMHWLTTAELKATGMMTEPLNGEQLLNISAAKPTLRPKPPTPIDLNNSANPLLTFGDKPAAGLPGPFGTCHSSNGVWINCDTPAQVTTVPTKAPVPAAAPAAP